MLREVRLKRKLLSTAVTGERLHFGVSLRVGPQVALVCESFVTLVTSERLLPGVCPDVALQQPGPRETLSTEGTFAALGVCPQVHR